MSQWSLMSGEEGAGERYYRTRNLNDEIVKVDCEEDERSDTEILSSLNDQLASGQIKAFEFIYRHEGFSAGRLVDELPELSKSQAIQLKSVFEEMNWHGLIENDEVPLNVDSQDDINSFFDALKLLNAHLEEMAS